MHKPGIRETLVDYYWVICFSLAMLAMLIAARVSPPGVDELTKVSGTVEQVATARLGLSYRVARLTVETPAGREQVFVDIGRIADASQNPRFRNLVALVGHDVRLSVARDRASAERFAYEISARDRPVLTHKDATYWGHLRHQTILLAAGIFVMIGFYGLHLRFGAYHTRRREPEFVDTSVRPKLAFLVEQR